MNEFLIKQQPEYCINAVAISNPERCETDPNIAYNVNTWGVFNIVRACQKTKTKLIHLSIYGCGAGHKFNAKRNNKFFEWSSAYKIISFFCTPQQH